MRSTAWQYPGRIRNDGLVIGYGTFDTNGFRSNSKTQRKQFNGKLSVNPNDQTQVNVVFNQFDIPARAAFSKESQGFSATAKRLSHSVLTLAFKQRPMEKSGTRLAHGECDKA